MSTAQPIEPIVEFPLSQGERYQAEVPDTLDLAARAELALNCLGGMIDPDRQYEPYARVQYGQRTPWMNHQAYGCMGCAPKFAESFPLLRVMSGSELHADREGPYMGRLVASLAPDDGLLWNPYDQPWGAGEVASVHSNGRMLRAMTAWRERDGDPAWDARLRAMARGLTRVAIDRGDYAYYPEGRAGDPSGEAGHYTRDGWRDTAEPASDQVGLEGSITAYIGHQIYGLGQWCQHSGDETALNIARKLARFCMQPQFWEGEEGQAHFTFHIHARMTVLRGILEYARAADDRQAMAFVRSGYEWVLGLAMRPLGWVTHSLGFAFSDSCIQADLVALGIRLSDLGLGDHWDDVDATVRNALTEQQAIRADLLEKVAAAHPERPPRAKSTHPGEESEEEVIPRTLGNFFSAPGVTADPSPVALIMCCPSNASQALYYAWEGALRHEDGTVLVNLLLNRASRWADVDSYLPYEGKVVVQSKDARRVDIRVPAWVDRARLRATIDAEPRLPAWRGNRALFDVEPGGRLVLEFPVPETEVTVHTMPVGLDESYVRSAQEHAQHQEWGFYHPERIAAWGRDQAYRCTLRGSTVVDISPRDEAPTSYPFYLRDHLRADRAPLKTVTRFAPQRVITNW